MYDPESNSYTFRAYLGDDILGMRIGEPYSHIYGAPAIIFISPFVKEDDEDYVKLHELIHDEDEYKTRIITEILAKDLLDKAFSPLFFYI